AIRGSRSASGARPDAARRPQRLSVFRSVVVRALRPLAVEVAVIVTRSFLARRRALAVFFASLTVSVALPFFLKVLDFVPSVKVLACFLTFRRSFLASLALMVTRTLQRAAPLT